MSVTFADLKKCSFRIVQFTGLELFGNPEIYCRSVSEKELGEYEASHWKPGTTEVDTNRLMNTRRKLLAMTVCNADGSPILTEDEAGELDSKLAGILFDQAQEHVKPAKKSSTTAAAPGSASPPISDAPTPTASSTN